MPRVVAIVGRPNVGKSALFNRLAGRRIAIVHDQPGVTRDRVTAEVEWSGLPFTLIDTGGIGLQYGQKTVDPIQVAALQQVDLAIESADVILFVVNVQEGIVPLDEEVARKLRSARKPVIIAVNKVDHDRAELGVGEFVRLGFQQVFPVSAIHGMGVETLLEATFAHDILRKPDEALATGGPIETAMKLAIVGRPNVGKSSLINALSGSERVVVSPIPGTTRDAVDVPFEVTTDGVRQRFVLIDTAGLRKARRLGESVEYVSVERTKDAIARSNIVILVLDAEAGVMEQDKKIADFIVEHNRACILVVNKWDLVAEAVREARASEVRQREERSRSRDDRQKRLTTLSEFGEWVQSRLFFLDYAPVIFTSATEGFQLERLLEAVRYVAAQLRQRVPTAILNRTLRDAIERRQPVSQRGHRLKFYYATQVKLSPPTFLLFVNRADLFAEVYRKYLANELRRAFGYEGCPLVLVPKARPKTIEPVRRIRRHPFDKSRDKRHGRPIAPEPVGSHLYDRWNEDPAGESAQPRKMEFEE